MNHLARIQEHLPGLTLASGCGVQQFLDVVALELEAFQEDLDRMRKTHWIHFAFRLADAEKLAALVGVNGCLGKPCRPSGRRLLPLVKARLNDALGPLEIKRFVYDYLRETESALSDVDSQRLNSVGPKVASQRILSSPSVLCPSARSFRPLELREIRSGRRTSRRASCRPLRSRALSFPLGRE